MDLRKAHQKRLMSLKQGYLIHFHEYFLGND